MSIAAAATAVIAILLVLAISTAATAVAAPRPCLRLRISEDQPQCACTTRCRHPVAFAGRTSLRRVPNGAAARGLPNTPARRNSFTSQAVAREASPLRLLRVRLDRTAYRRGGRPVLAVRAEQREIAANSLRRLSTRAKRRSMALPQASQCPSSAPHSSRTTSFVTGGRGGGWRGSDGYRPRPRCLGRPVATITRSPCPTLGEMPRQGSPRGLQSALCSAAGCTSPPGGRCAEDRQQRIRRWRQPCGRSGRGGVVHLQHQRPVPRTGRLRQGPTTTILTPMWLLPARPAGGGAVLPRHGRRRPGWATRSTAARPASPPQ